MPHCIPMWSGELGYKIWLKLYLLWCLWYMRVIYRFSSAHIMSIISICKFLSFCEIGMPKSINFQYIYILQCTHDLLYKTCPSRTESTLEHSLMMLNDNDESLRLWSLHSDGEERRKRKVKGKWRVSENTWGDFRNICKF